MNYVDVLNNVRALCANASEAVIAHNKIVGGISFIIPRLAAEGCTAVSLESGGIPEPPANTRLVRIDIPFRPEGCHVKHNAASNMTFTGRSGRFISIVITPLKGSRVRDRHISLTLDGALFDLYSVAIGNEGSLYWSPDFYYPCESAEDLFRALNLLTGLFFGTDRWTISGDTPDADDLKAIQWLHHVQDHLHACEVTAPERIVPTRWTPPFSEEEFFSAMEMAGASLLFQGEEREYVALFRDHAAKLRAMFNVADSITTELARQCDGEHGGIVLITDGHFGSDVLVSRTSDEYRSCGPLTKWGERIGNRNECFAKAADGFPALQDLYVPILPGRTLRQYEYWFNLMEILYTWYTGYDARSDHPSYETVFGSFAHKKVHPELAALFNGTFDADLQMLNSCALTIPHLYPVEFLAGQC